MAKIEKDTLEFLGFDYQYKLLAQILTDKRFANSIIDILDANYFMDEHLKLITAAIKDAKEEYDIIPDFSSIEFRMLDKITNPQTRKYVLSQLKRIKETSLNDTLKVQEVAMKFCKTQELKKSIKQIAAIIDKGDTDEYEKCESILRKALEHGDSKDDGMDVLHDLESVLDEDFRKPIPTGIKGLDEIMDGGLSKGELAVILAPFGVGKSLSNSSKVYTPDGYKLMADIKVGDYVISRVGEPTKVLGVYPQGVRGIYKVTFNDGTSAMCDKEHLWAVNSINQRNRSSWKDGKRIKLKPDHSFKVVETSKLIDDLTFGSRGCLKYKIPMVKPVNFNEVELPLNPYILGLLLGDGYMKQTIITTKDVEIIDSIKSIMGDENVYSKERCKDIDKGDLLVQQCAFSVSIHGIKGVIKEIGLFDCLSDTKFIPKNYLYNSVENRVSLLQGLLDTDGTVNTRGGIEYCTVSKQLANDVKELVLSLGGFCKIKEKQPKYTYKGVKKNGKLAYTLNISFPIENGIIPFKLGRKLNKVKNREKYSNNKFIKSIEYSHDEEATCIMVEDEEHLFVTDDYIVTHNTTMMTKICNTAMNEGHKVLQIFFEDMPRVIQRKHLACWSGHDLNSLVLHKDDLIKMGKNMTAASKNGTGEIKLKKFSSDGTTIPMIRQYIRQQIASGFRPDLITLDYIDCVTPSKKFDDVNAGEGAVMRQFESMLSELDLAGWTAVQGNRSSISAEVVEANQMGGSIKKGQIGHFIVSIAKTLDQKDEGTATMAILKSRFGKDGMIFPNIVFDNARIQIEMGDAEPNGQNRTQYKKGVADQEQNRVNAVIQARQTTKNN